VLAPVAVRNAVVGGEFHLTTAQFGPNFYIGNHENATGSYVPLRWDRDAPEFERRDATELAERALERPLSAGEVSRYWTRQALRYIGEHPGQWLRLMGRKLALAANTGELIDGEDIYSYADWSLVLRFLQHFLNFGVLAPLAVFGIRATWPRRREHWFLHALLGLTWRAFSCFTSWADIATPSLRC